MLVDRADIGQDHRDRSCCGQPECVAAIARSAATNSHPNVATTSNVAFAAIAAASAPGSPALSRLARILAGDRQHDILDIDDRDEKRRLDADFPIPAGSLR